MSEESKIEEQPVQEKEEVKKSVPREGKFAVVLVRGKVGLPQPVKDTLLMLKLNRKNTCVVVEINPINKGMLMKVKDYVTWGEITEETFKGLIKKRGKEYKGRTSDSKGKYTFKTLDIDGKKYKRYFTLNPPRKGFGRKGIKVAFKVGGALGYRADKMNDLIARML
jgi:large subunit ribosomal protein L30